MIIESLKAGMICGTKVVPMTSTAFISASLRRWLMTSKLAKVLPCLRYRGDTMCEEPTDGSFRGTRRGLKVMEPR